MYLGNIFEIKTIETGIPRTYKFTRSNKVLTIEGHFRQSVTISFLYEKWLYLEARDYLLERANKLASANGFKMNKVSVRRQTSRWGSCSLKGNISLNYRLMKYSQEIIDYVIFHELCHLIEMNHSKKFWNLVEKYIPNYRDYRKALKNPI